MIEEIPDYEFKKQGFARLSEIIRKGFFSIYLILAKPKRFFFLMNTNFKGFFVETGFFRSYEKKLPIDKNGSPLPWVTYSFIYFIKERLKSDFHLFEYGSGNSTKFYASLVEKVTSIEHDKEWVAIVKNNIPENANVHYFDIDDGYVTGIRELNAKYDVIIVDGRKRVECIKESIHHLSNDGVIVLDDSFRKNYAEAFDFMESNGFKKIDFWGPAPIAFRNKSTTIFYRKENCLKI